MSEDQKARLHAAAKRVSINNMKHEAAMKECLDIMAEIIGDDLQCDMAKAASLLEECFYSAKANHARLNRVGCDALGWDIPVALSR